jgi:hypothetical protein
MRPDPQSLVGTISPYRSNHSGISHLLLQSACQPLCIPTRQRPPLQPVVFQSGLGAGSVIREQSSNSTSGNVKCCDHSFMTRMRSESIIVSCACKQQVVLVDLDCRTQQALVQNFQDLLVRMLLKGMLLHSLFRLTVEQSTESTSMPPSEFSAR